MENYEVTFSRLPLSSRINPGTDVMILKIFSPKNRSKNWRYLTQNKAKLSKNFDHNIGF
jgi:hypothetical protein